MQIVTAIHRQFSEEDIEIANRHIKRHSPLLIIREMHIKTAMRHHLTPVRMMTIINAREGAQIFPASHTPDLHVQKTKCKLSIINSKKKEFNVRRLR